jgi:3-phenylpropionate/cinnamic acid dioxygenase small subunit
MNDYESIRNALAEYCQLNDDGRFDEWGQLLAEDVKFSYGDMVEVNGRGAVKAFVSEAQPPEKRGKHLIANQLIKVDGDRADVTADFVFFAPGDGVFPVIAANRYRDVLVRSGDRWIFSEVHIELFGAARPATN